MIGGLVKFRTMDVVTMDGKNTETFFVRALNRLFKTWGKAIARNPWIFIVASHILTIFCSLRIPFTPMTNDVADFTPYGARARNEIEAYQSFFSNKGDPIVLFLLVTAKNTERNMLGVRELEETVQLLNAINERFTVYDSINSRNISYAEFCDNFCTINEPVRHFHSGLLLEQSFGNSSLDHIDLGYPITTVLGRQLHMDPHFFGVRVAVKDRNGTIIEVSVNEMRAIDEGHRHSSTIFDTSLSQIPNNIRAISLVGLHFRAIRPTGVSKESIQNWQRQIAIYMRDGFKGEYVDALVLSETLLTDEVVKAGLTLLPFLVIGFVLMVIMSSLTMGLAAFYMGQMGPHKILLAFVACCCPFMACGTALGGMFWMGFRFGSLLCVTPFLVLALGVDDAYLMLNSWQRLSKKMRSERAAKEKETASESVGELVEKLMGDVMVDTGASITITTLTNVLAFAIGATTPTPEIRLFSIGNAIAITVVYIYQWTVFGSVMALFGCYEFRQWNVGVHSLPADSASGHSEADSGLEIRGSLNSMSRSNSSTKSDTQQSRPNRQQLSRAFRRVVQKICKRFLRFYCQALANCWVALGVMSILAAYIYASIYGLLNIRAELKPEQLFLQTSEVQRILQLRNEFIMPFYAVCLVFVNNPGNFSDPLQRQKWHSLVADFEALPSSVGTFATKFWLRDYEQFVATDSEEEAAPIDDLAKFEGISLTERYKNELNEFLQWPEFQFWNGFIQMEQRGSNQENSRNQSNAQMEPKLSRFFFTTAAYGIELKEWSKREQLLGEWRKVADSYPELEVSIYEDEAKFLDLIPTMIPQTLQSAVCTLFCMFLICLLFMTNPGSLLVSIFAIFSTCIGVFGIQSLMGTALDPIFMSAAIMSIGFSVDIPAHIAYHFYKTGVNDGAAAERDVVERLRECLSAISFPVLEAGFSTLICVGSLFFVNLHMAQIFAFTMTLVVAIGLLHGLLIIPVMLCQISTLFTPLRKEKEGQDQANRKRITTKFQLPTTENSMTTIRPAVMPTVLMVNQQDKF